MMQNKVRGKRTRFCRQLLLRLRTSTLCWGWTLQHDARRLFALFLASCSASRKLRPRAHVGGRERVSLQYPAFAAVITSSSSPHTSWTI